jgi:hypothetical protein
VTCPSEQATVEEKVELVSHTLETFELQPKDVKISGAEAKMSAKAWTSWSLKACTEIVLTLKMETIINARTRGVMKRFILGLIPSPRAAETVSWVADQGKLTRSLKLAECTLH